MKNEDLNRTTVLSYFMFLAVIAALTIFVTACATFNKDKRSSSVTYDPKDFSRSVCLMGNDNKLDWKELSQAPVNANELKQQVYKNRNVNEIDQTEIWYEAPDLLLMCSTSGASLCGHTTYRFKREGDQWKEDGSELVWCDIRK